MPLDGTLRDMSLPTLVQLQCSEQRRAQVQLLRRGREGLLFFANGELIHARVGALSGDQAIYEMLTWDDGEFHVSDVNNPPTQTINGSWQSLMMEGLRRADEAKEAQKAKVAALKQVVPTMNNITEWALCHPDGQQLNEEGDAVSNPLGAWVASTTLNAERLSNWLGAGATQEIVLVGAKQKRLLTPHDRYWLVLSAPARLAADAIRNAWNRAKASL